MRVCGVILAGGGGRRMGGADKGLVMLRDRPLAQWASERLAPQVAELMIVANRNLDRYRGLAPLVVHDVRGGFLGPLAGFEAALSATRRSWILTCPTDAPLLPADYAQRMIVQAGGRPAVACVADRLQPVHALLPRRCLPGLRAYLSAGGRKVMTWLESLSPVVVAFDDCPEAFIDADTPEDLQALVARLWPAETATLDAD